MPGPVPKRSEQRRRTNTPVRELVKPSGAAPAPELTGDVHPLARSFYESLAASPEADFYSAAVWQRALIHVHVLSSVLEERGNRGISSMLYTALQHDWKSLLVDPAEQRRLGIEIQAAPEVNPNELRADATVTSIMDRLQQGA